MKLIVSYSCLVWLVYVSVAASEQADQHHEDKMVTVTKEVDSKPRGTEGEKDKEELDLKERKMDWDSSFGSGSSEEGDMKDRGLFDGGLFGGGYGKQRRRNGRMFSSSSFGGYGGGRGRGRGRPSYGQQFYEEPRYGMGYGNGGFGRFDGAYPDRRFSMQPYGQNRYMPYAGGRGGRQLRGYPGEGGFYGQQPSYRQPYYRDLQPESTIPVEPVAAR